MMTEPRKTPSADMVLAAMNNAAFDKSAVLLGYQKRWIADESSLKIAEKSRRTGITWAEAADAALTAAKSRTAGGADHFYIGSNKEMAREFIDAVAMWASAYGMVASEIGEEVFNDEDKDILTFVVNFGSGFKVQALSSNPKNLRGMQGNVTIDEAAFHDRLAEVLKAALALTMWGSKVRLISTHNGTDNQFNQLINDSRAGRKRYVIHTITLDDACADGLYQRICQVMRKAWTQDAEDEWKANLLKDTLTEEDALEEYYCVPKQGGGAYIPRPMLDRAARPEHVVVSFASPKGWMEWTEEQRRSEVQAWCEEHLAPLLAELDTTRPHAFGEDFARKGDLSVFSVGSVEADTKRKMRITVELHDVTYNQQREIMFYILERLPRFCGGAFDATGNGGYLAEAALLRYGATMIESIQLNDPWYREWMPKYKALFESDMIEIPQNEDVIADQRHIQVIRGVPKIDKSRTEGANGAKRHGDSAVSYCMCVRASYLDGYEIDYTELPSRHRHEDRNPDSDMADDMYHEFERGCW